MNPNLIPEFIILLILPIAMLIGIAYTAAVVFVYEGPWLAFWFLLSGGYFVGHQVQQTIRQFGDEE